LIDAILCGTIDEIENILTISQYLLRESNLLGQTPIHAAVLRPNVLLRIITLCQDMDTRDDYRGGTPLDYAAAYGQTESLIILLEHGADPFDGQHMSFFRYAEYWSQWHLMSEAFAFLKANGEYSDSVLQHEAENILLRCQHIASLPPEGFTTMVNLGIDTWNHVFFQNDDTLLHRVASEAFARILLEKGFQNIDLGNKQGQTALISSTGNGWYDVSRVILERGCNVNHQDDLGFSALHIICGNIKTMNFHMLARDFGHAAKLLQCGADPLSRDKCRCPCSTNGCSPILELLHQQTLCKEPFIHSCSHDKGYVWVLELLLMLNEFQGPDITRKVLLDLIRFNEFQKAKMTHVCRRNHCSVGDRSTQEDVDIILEEQNQSISDLNQKMKEATLKFANSSIEETWLSVVGDFHLHNRPEPDLIWSLWDPSTGYFNANQQKVPLIPLSMTCEASQGDVYTDEIGDEYWELFELPFSSHSIKPSQLYSSWVQGVYDLRWSGFEGVFKIDKKWYETRKYWADRQAEVLEGLSAGFEPS